MKTTPIVDMTADGSKVQCYKEQYCVGTWNVRSIIKQEMVRVKIDILGINEAKWTAMGEFN